MGRAKIAMEFIKKEKIRNATYVKRKKGLLKKSYELSILCNVPICIILYPYQEGKQSFEVEVYSFKGENYNEMAPASNPVDWSKAKDPKITREIIERYLRVPKEARNKKALNLCDMFDEWTKKADQDLCKLRQQRALSRYSSSSNNYYVDFDGFNVNQLLEVLVHLDQKIEFVKQRISAIINCGNGNDIDHNHNQNAVNLMPYYYFEPKSIMIPSDDNIIIHQNQMGCLDEFDGINQFPLFNYPIISNINQGYCHQIMPFNHHHHHQQQQQCNALIDQVGASRSNMNMVYDLSAMYYDQGSGMVDHGEPSSSNGGDLPKTMPLQLPVMQHNNVSLPMQIMQYQHMFYS